jgi:AraC-like DNA-binding protein
MERDPKFSDTIVFESPLVRIGAFRCDRDYLGFQDTGPADNDCFVFPRTAVGIEHEHEPPFAANPNVVTFYNRGQRYLRHGVSDNGDRCDWFGIHREIVREAVGAPQCARHGSQPAEPFPWTRGRCDSATYLHQRRIFEAARNGSVSPMAIEEESIELLARVASQTVAPSSGHREIVHETENVLGARFDQAFRLSQIAALVGVSVFHLCRTFRANTGLSIHGYLKQLRVRNGLERICNERAALSVVALELGFAHHSHFTSAFHREFGMTPTKARAQITSCGFRC